MVVLVATAPHGADPVPVEGPWCQSVHDQLVTSLNASVLSCLVTDRLPSWKFGASSGGRSLDKTCDRVGTGRQRLRRSSGTT
jgi:hypothetical protein